MGKLRVGWAVVVGGLALAPGAARAEDWATIATGQVNIKTRSRPNSPVREVWAEGDVNATVQDVEATLLDAESYPRFMPFVKEVHYLGKPDADGTRLVYTRIEPPVVSSRDYVVRILVDKRVAPDGTGEFINRWESVPDKLPSRANVVRLRLNEGSWVVTPRGAGKSHIVYKCAVDPGGWMPPFIIDMANRNGVFDTFKAVEKEAQRRSTQRKEQAHAP